MATNKTAGRPKLKSSHQGANSAAGAKKGKPASGSSGPSATKARPKTVAASKAKPASKPKAHAPTRELKNIIVNELDLEKRPKKKARVDTSLASDSARQVAISVATAALDKKASGLEIIEVAGKVDYTDFLVLMSGRSDRHVAALSNAIDESLRKKNIRPLAVEGQQRSLWIVMDYRDVVVHIFQEDARNLYDLDGLWIDARRVSVPMPTREGVPAQSDW